ncbi:P-loop containing nucleoside triphosphate hydrolase protein [Exidia glandulosa HHB12029]|uniref:Signal recognition particle receptor subunit beta n=1 Tax=Exidia glandulosa HHB12029 TaxID=1314781 RepID=A0A165CDW2_EXIGL|nr:P-loop containing nucleoside triphosphate hydrolase protein [Exidia glandulosa HHB12029]
MSEHAQEPEPEVAPVVHDHEHHMGVAFNPDEPVRDDLPDVELDRDPLVLTPSDDAALPPQVEDLAQTIEVISTSLPSSTPIAQAALPAVAGAGNTMLLMGGSLVVAVLLALIAILLARRSSKRKGTDVLLVGPSDAGKTALFASLVHGRAVPSHTSMQPNIGVLSGPEKTRLVDVPGHPRLRVQDLADHLPAAKGVLFVVDASTIARNGTAVAEHLHEVMHALSSLPNSTPPPVAILASKCDLAGSHANATTRVRTVLERELDKRRAARVDVDEAESGAMGGLDTLGPRGGSFKFAEWEGGEVQVLGGWCHIARPGEKSADLEKDGEKDSLREVREWVEGLE